MIIKSSKKSEVAAALATLKINKTYRIKEIVDTIKQVCNHQTDTTNSLKMNSGNYSGVGCVMLDELYVDLTYQRRIRLAKIINKLKKEKGFDKDVAGAIDIAIRPDGKCFVWDGLRRAIMVGMCGGDRITASQYIHEKHLYDEDCREVALSHLRGSASIAHLSDSVVALERNQQAEDEHEANTTTLRILKNRYTGDTGVACYLHYNKESGRMTQVDNPFMENENEE